MTAVDAKVTVHSEHHAVGPYLAHPHKARVGERHLHIAITRQEPLNDGSLSIEVERAADQVAANELDDRCRTTGSVAEEETRF